MKYTIDLGALSNGADMFDSFELPVLDHLGAMALCRQAMDECIKNRTGLAVVGPKGSGKTMGITSARRWMSGVQRERRAVDNSLRVMKVARFPGLRIKSEREVARLLARALSPAYSDRSRGKLKTPQEIRTDVIRMCAQGQVAAVVVDEAETFSDEALQCFRDLLAESQTSEDEAGDSSGGLGVILVGDETFTPRYHAMRDAGQRFAKVIEIGPVEEDDLADVYASWFPGFAAHILSLQGAAWRNYLASVLGRGRPVSFRYLENQAKGYAYYVARTQVGIRSREDIPFIKDLFELAAEECAFADASQASQGNGGSRRRRRGK